MYDWSLDLGLEKYCMVTLGSSGDSRNHGPRSVRFSNDGGSRVALKSEDSVMADATAA